MAAEHGHYFASLGSLVTGAGSTQNLISIANPAASGKVLHIARAWVQGSIDALAATPFVYHLAKTSDEPSGGTPITAVKAYATASEPAAIVRSAATSLTLVSGDIGTASPGGAFGLSLSGISAPLVYELFVGQFPEDSIQIEPGTGAVIYAGANSTAWNHLCGVVWRELA